MPGDSVLRSVRAVFVAAVMYVAMLQCEILAELYFRVLICNEILRREMALNSILREILEF